MRHHKYDVQCLNPRISETEEKLESVEAAIAVEKEKKPPIQEEINKFNADKDCLADIARREGAIKGARDMIELQIAGRIVEERWFGIIQC